MNINIADSLKDVLGNDYYALIEEYYESTIATINSTVDDYQSLSLEQKINKVHSLKGSSANVGAEYIASLFMEMETMLKSGAEFDFNSAIDNVKNHLEDSVAALRAR